jgi:hypothetical protein
MAPLLALLRERTSNTSADTTHSHLDNRTSSSNSSNSSSSNRLLSTYHR